ncbi:MAG: hypothetical protein AB1609_09430, partial [Bacillota bacterium]
TPLEIQPVYHWSEPGVRGHITSAVLALLLARMIEQRLEAAGMPQRARTALSTLAEIDEVEIDWEPAGCTGWPPERGAAPAVGGVNRVTTALADLAV